MDMVCNLEGWFQGAKLGSFATGTKVMTLRSCLCLFNIVCFKGPQNVDAMTPVFRIRIHIHFVPLDSGSKEKWKS